MVEFLEVAAAHVKVIVITRAMLAAHEQETTYTVPAMASGCLNRAHVIVGVSTGTRYHEVTFVVISKSCRQITCLCNFRPDKT